MSFVGLSVWIVVGYLKVFWFKNIYIIMLKIIDLLQKEIKLTLFRVIIERLWII